mmetsp:Transcript_26248/g.36106  ORF Transcript_26248/g.36106 Transcript_26248/m.36106 type:complete len:85 (-) Transcript_26248:1604-1858(-)
MQHSNYQKYLIEILCTTRKATPYNRIPMVCVLSAIGNRNSFITIIIIFRQLCQNVIHRWFGWKFFFHLLSLECSIGFTNHFHLQ